MIQGISTLTIDPREVCPGTLFVARKSWYEDTHELIPQVIEAGASAILVSDKAWESYSSEIPIYYHPKEDPTLGELSDLFYGEPTRKLKVFGVTGTNGKSSTVGFLEHLLTALGERVAVMGTLEYRFEAQRLEAPNTTPDALLIHRFAAEALALGATALVLEVSSHGLSLERVAGIRFDAVGFTMLGHDHLDFHGSLEAYRAAKGRLFGEVLEESIAAGKSPVAVAMGSEEGAHILQRTPDGVPRYIISTAQPLTDGAGEGLCELFRLSPSEAPSLQGTSLSMTAGVAMGEAALAAPTRAQWVSLIGDYHPDNLALACGLALTYRRGNVAALSAHRLNQIWAALPATPPVPGRMEPSPSLTEERDPAGRLAVIDYAHTPDALERAIQALKSVHQGHIEVLVGCGGDRDKEKRAPMAAIAAALADRVWLSADNPREERAAQIIDEMYLGVEVRDRARIYIEEDRRAAIARAWAALPPQGALLIAGKGHERYQDAGGRRFALDEREALRCARIAEALDLPLEEVPLIESDPTLRGELKELASLWEVLEAAAARPGGIHRVFVESGRAPRMSESLSIDDLSLIDARLDRGRLEDLAPCHRVVLVSLSKEEEAPLSRLIGRARSGEGLWWVGDQVRCPSPTMTVAASIPWEKLMQPLHGGHPLIASRPELPRLRPNSLTEK
ncbi:MAG: UDP-N-acetylmuramoyl-L-alanyl-D-glutamate--2,6-diaminopimelate ligase [Myxococcota bacterium]|nr:UDP-N-acetylmuramoyl-L-alanyl-D-glutamate--2,6-diaminopimelate ligase [Myxococcota bacterium]